MRAEQRRYQKQVCHCVARDGTLQPYILKIYPQTLICAAEPPPAARGLYFLCIQMLRFKSKSVIHFLLRQATRI